MTTSHYNGNFEVIRYTLDINALGATTTSSTTFTLPAYFRVLEGFLDADAGTTNNSLDVGISGGDTDIFFDGVDNSGGAVVGSPLLATGKGYRSTSDQTIVVKNAGSAAIPSAETNVTITLIGQREYE